MSHVLGVVIKSIRSEYSAICSSRNEPVKAHWLSVDSTSRMSSLRRYQWVDFTNYLNAVSRHLEEIEISPLAFQRKFSPVMFSKIISTRFAQTVFKPLKLLKAIDVWAGPFLFRSGRSNLKVVAENLVKFEIELFDERETCPVFFEHCSAGLQATLELLSFTNITVLDQKNSGRRLEVIFNFSDVSHARERKPCVLVNLEDIQHFVEDIVQDLADPDFLDQLVLEHWLESVDHIDRISRQTGEKSGYISNKLTVMSSRIQLALVYRAKDVTYREELENAHIAGQELLDFVSKSLRSL